MLEPNHPWLLKFNLIVNFLKQINLFTLFKEFEPVFNFVFSKLGFFCASSLHQHDANSSPHECLTFQIGELANTNSTQYCMVLTNVRINF
jgi:hypothetical protein